MKKETMVWNLKQLLEKEQYFHVYPYIDKSLNFEIDDFYQPETFYETSLIIYIFKNKYGEFEYFVLSTRGIYWKYKTKYHFEPFKKLKEKVWFDFDKSLLKLNLSDGGIHISNIKRSNAENLCRLINIYTEEYRNKNFNRKYLVSIKGKIHGPWDFKYIKDLIVRGKIQKDLIRLNPEDEEQKWYDFYEMPEFFEDDSFKKIKIKKMNILKCDPDIILFSDGMNIDKVEKIMQAREEGRIFTSIEQVGEFIDLKPHNIRKLSEKFYIENNIISNGDIKNKSDSISFNGRRIVDY
ncbi:MAG: hypothetical protein M0P94_04155 [Candidatus Absconditabacterales bacterium]|nr:hypothetical protein [Candidatus Absconditabacterales bacterium]